MHVRAIYHYGFEFYRLESPICCEESATKIWVQADTLDDRSERLFRKLDKGMGWALVVFVGRFDVNNGPMGERYRLTVDQIVKVEKTARARHSEVPDWVPKNCQPH
jgi:hypothetical protein